ncbi:PREDICTED: mitochondrial antiviral-signaling protein isoform X2 [Gekko japonicus]|uniref:Mitochondrial antiviral-signaling protein isoform X2 n=1 Tax=Gekko japonicus TaxID=146911 RepID=A0ABM1KND0_GEKJA|nr:PREDICTED: mitochondrial antiviral-signaling protein isoform X2 [Gekko japonicus]
MGFAEDKVKKFIQQNYHLFHDVPLNQLLDFLPCLTSADRQEIRCHTDRRGNVSSVSEFFDHLWGRSGWVTQLIDALEKNNSGLAEVIREVYEDALLPSQRASTARSPPSVAQSRSVSVPVGFGAPSSDGTPLSPPRNQPRPTSNPLPTCVNALAPAPSAPLPDVVDYRSPVQETKFPSWSGETLPLSDPTETTAASCFEQGLEEKACGDDVKRTISTPDQHNRNAAESNADLTAQHENPASGQAAPPRSPVQHQTPLREVSEKEVQSSTPISSSSGAGPFVPETPRTASSLGQSLPKSSPLPQRSSRTEHFGQVPSAVPVARFPSPPSDFSGSSSTDVIPPSSPAAISVTLSDMYLEELNPPVQERNLRGTGLCATSEKVTGDVPPRANVVWPSYAADIPANSRENRNNATGPSRGAQLFHSNREEEDVSLLKPGALRSEEITGGPLDQHSSDRSAEYSGTSDRLRYSDGSSEVSDPLMLSNSTQGSRTEYSERNTPMGTNRASLRRRNDNHSDGGSVRTHTVRVEEPPSVDLTGAPEITRPAHRHTSQPPGDFSDSAAGDQLTENGSSCSVRSDGPRNSRPNESVTDAGSWHMSDSMRLAVGFTLASLAVVAFVLYKQLKK